MRLAVHAEQANRRGNGRLRLARRGSLQTRENRQRRLVADLAERDRGIDLKRPISLGDLGDRPHGIGRLVVAERLDQRAAEVGLPLHDLPGHRLFDLRVSAVGRQRAGQGRPHELGRLGHQRGKQLGHDGRVGIVLEITVSDRAQAIVLLRQRGAHDVAGARVVEPGEQDERAKADERVRMGFHGLEQRGHGNRRIGPPGRPRRSHAVAELDGAELVDRRGELGRSNGVARIRRRAAARGRRRRRGAGGLVWAVRVAVHVTATAAMSARIGFSRQPSRRVAGTRAGRGGRPADTRLCSTTCSMNSAAAQPPGGARRGSDSARLSAATYLRMSSTL